MKAAIALTSTLAVLALAAPAMAAPGACPPAHPARMIHRIATHRHFRRESVRTVYVTQVVRVPVEVPVEADYAPQPVYDDRPAYVGYDYGWYRGGYRGGHGFYDYDGGRGEFRHDGGHWGRR